MEEDLSRAAIDGIHALEEILNKNPHILNKVIAGYFKTNPLHVAISMNQILVVKELLKRNKGLAEVLDSGRSPLHLAAAKGDVEIVKALIEASEDMCLARDPDGRNPVHIAAMKGKDEVLEVLVRKSPNAARMKLDRDETILHLCVKHGQLKTLELLLNMNIGLEFANAKDSSGNTILHLAVSTNNFGILQHIANHDVTFHPKRKLEVNATNAEGDTALDLAELLERTRDFKNVLLNAKCKRAKDVVQRDWLTRKRDTLMVVASLIATMAFQAAVSPPAGVWQDNSNGHRAGEAVMAYNYPDSYPYFLRANTIAFVSSLSTILLLISDVPFKNRLYMWCLVVIMWLTITSTAITYGFSITVVTPKPLRGSLSNTIMVGVIVWCSVMAVLLAYHTGKLIKDQWNDWVNIAKSAKDINFFGISYRSHTDHDQSAHPHDDSVYDYANHGTELHV